ncbi:MAG TPA: M50 family metallopeptidase [Kofleriaceae bacterium]
MQMLVAVLVCIVLVAVAELVRFGVAKLLRLPVTRAARVFLDPHGGPRWARAVAIFAGTVTTYVGVVVLAFAYYAVDGIPTKYLEVTVEEAAPGFPAVGKLRKGDRIIAVDGQPIEQSLNLSIDQRKGAPVRLTFHRGNTTQDVTLQPIGHDGHWIVGVRPRTDFARSYDGAVALKTALAYPIAQTQALVPADEPAADPGGPKRIFDIYGEHQPSPGAIALRESMLFGVYVLLLVVLIDLVRAVRAITRRDTRV